MHTSVEESVEMEWNEKWLWVLVCRWTCNECVTLGKNRNQSTMLSEFGIFGLVKSE